MSVAQGYIIMWIAATKKTTKQQNHSKRSKGRNCKTYRKVAPTMKWCEM